MWLWTLVWGTLVKQHFCATPVQLAGVTTYWNTTPRGFEPLRAEPNGFRVHPLNRSGTVSYICTPPLAFFQKSNVLLHGHGCICRWMDGESMWSWPAAAADRGLGLGTFDFFFVKNDTPKKSPKYFS